MSRFPFASLDLSLLPAPTIVTPADYQAILAARIVDLVARFAAIGIAFDVESLQTDPSIIHQQVDAFREKLDRQAINDAAKGVMLAYAVEGDLDNLVALLGLRRLTITPANTETGAAAVMETDDDLRRRGPLALDGTAPGFTSRGYRGYALQIAPEIQDVATIKRGGGRVDVILLGRGEDGSVASDVVARVAAALYADDGAQLTDIVTVRSATPRPYDVVVQALVPTGPSIAMARAASLAALSKTLPRLKVIGGTVRTDAIIAAGRVEPMTEFTLISPVEHVVAAPDEAPWPRSISVTVEARQ
ncbi:baseplate J/gp47 family protein [Methylosinus sp. Sm6]|uniref:baseplate J/gp47 family protein n=1 Tax=Methylosinus sp. Sm6 TaxID=2866948 RepID=UPI001C990461|nr:baseplate J/gp47 family protein [Methylosinus sp. Sm6]MBY6243740.1 baseplate J/gp47 family protein [Methylosinus sp. Sm6]